MKWLFSSFLSMLLCSVLAQKIIPPDPVLPLPSQRQLDWMSMEMNAFIHFTTNTFTDLEWGRGDENESVFNPTAANPEQWVEVLKNTGFKGIILTCKHHDGFCLWSSAYTNHSIKNSPYKNGKGYLVREVSDACKNAGIGFGIYLSPWDRNSAVYAKPEYINYYRNQLTELIAGYGPVFELWFDGANGGTGYYGGANEKRQISQDYYDWGNTIKLARSLQKEEMVIFSDDGPDIRWVGNEQGYVCETNWYSIDPDSCHIRRPGFEKIIGTGMENGSAWIPSEVDVSIRPGWFYHASEDSLVKSPEKLFEIYLQSVGRGAVLLLNVPPDRRGLIHENDVKALQGFRKILDNAFKTNLIEGAKVSVSSTRGKANEFGCSQLTDENPDTYWATDDETTQGTIEIELRKEQVINYIVLHEYLKLGQRIRAFSVEVKIGDKWILVASGTTVGYKRILKIDPVITDKIRVNISDAKACLTVSGVEVF
jgi:alpha-L-fucosidase